MLNKILRERMEKDGISLRAAAAQIGISHNTLYRTLEGQPIDLDTLTLLARWLGVRPSTLIDAEAGDVASMVALILEQNPEMVKVFREVFEKYHPKVLQEIMWYMLWRMSRDPAADESPAELSPATL